MLMGYTAYQDNSSFSKINYHPFFPKNTVIHLSFFYNKYRYLYSKSINRSITNIIHYNMNEFMQVDFLTKEVEYIYPCLISSANIPKNNQDSSKP